MFLLLNVWLFGENVFFSGFTRSAIVTLDSVQIFKTHEWLEKPTFYFKCQGENLTVIPDVKKTHVLYTFKGEESWQVGREWPFSLGLFLLL